MKLKKGQALLQSFMNNEKIFENAKEELKKLGIKADSFEEIREKEGIALLRIKICGKSFVFKYIENEKFQRETEIYEMLSSLEVETIKVFAMTEKSILMEDIAESEKFRLGTKEDMSDPVVAKALAKWYRNLHFTGYGYIEEYGKDLYSENALITKENLAFVKEKTETADLPVWKIIEDNFDKIKSAIESLRETFNYNDFYYTNLIVAKDKSKAFMFDYNISGKGPAVSDINNVCWSLSDEAAEAFLLEYGRIDERETIIEDVAAVLSSLCLACQKEEFPEWAKELIDMLENGFEEKIDAMLAL